MGPSRACHVVWITARNAGGHYHLNEKRQLVTPTWGLRRILVELYSLSMKLGNLARVLVVCGAALAGAASATSSSNQNTQPQYSQNSPPPPQAMEPSMALGLWKTSFGAVKIEADNSKGGLQTGALQGVWMYQR